MRPACGSFSPAHRLSLADSPRAAYRLQRGLAGRWAARRGTYRVLYAIDDQQGVVTVLAAEHRRDVYRRQ
ncbi:MAG: type II toxin-antitoxin system RelE family toxin [Acidimicrobiales bacterium]